MLRATFCVQGQHGFSTSWESEQADLFPKPFFLQIINPNHHVSPIRHNSSPTCTSKCQKLFASLNLHFLYFLKIDFDIVIQYNLLTNLIQNNLLIGEEKLCQKWHLRFNFPLSCKLNTDLHVCLCNPYTHLLYTWLVQSQHRCLHHVILSCWGMSSLNFLCGGHVMLWHHALFMKCQCMCVSCWETMTIPTMPSPVSICTL